MSPKIYGQIAELYGETAGCRWRWLEINGRNRFPL